MPEADGRPVSLWLYCFKGGGSFLFSAINFWLIQNKVLLLR